MIKALFFISLFLLALFSPYTVMANDKLSLIHKDESGACPFDGCMYGTWSVMDTINLYNTEKGSKIITKVARGEKVEAVTGVIFIEPGEVEITTNHEDYKKGDRVTVLSYYGEGIHLVSYKGKEFEDGTMYEIIQHDENEPKYKDKRWGKVIKHPGNQDWWVKIQMADGKVGWTNETDKFCDKGDNDSCASSCEWEKEACF